jgi:DNA (cytosine-5)-methyltransferase 1
MAGFKVVVASETDKHARATIHANRPRLRLIGDLRDYTAADVRSAAGIGKRTDIDLVCGGPPCQPWSVAGRHRGFDDPRDVLPAFVNLATALKPRYVVVENVHGFMRNVAAFDRILAMFKRAGYVLSWNLYDCGYFGVAQHRRRVVIVASRHGRVPFLAPSHSDRPQDKLPRWRVLRDVIGDMGRVEHHYLPYPSCWLPWFRLLAPGQNWRDLPDPEAAMGARLFQATGGRSESFRRLAWDKPCQTLLTKPCGVLTSFCHPEQDRPLSVEEYHLLQEFPVGWTICGDLRSRYRQLGNAVPVPLGEAIGKTLLRHMRTGSSSEERPGFRYSRHRDTSDLDRAAKERDLANALADIDRLCEEFGIAPVPPATVSRP